MIRLYVFGEGDTEEAIVNRVLVPHLSARNVFPYALSLGGGSRWAAWRNFMDRFMKQESRPDVYYTTVFDLYRLPKDFPEASIVRALADTRERARRFEAAMAANLGHPRLVPYIQRHEIEALVLPCLDHLAERLPDARAGIAKLQADIAHIPPEDVDDGPETHPSKRLERHVVGYGKLADGPVVIEQAGVARVRAACPGFDAWLTTLESLAGQAAP